MVSIEVDRENSLGGHNPFLEGCCFCERGNVGVIACTQRSDSSGEVSSVQLAARLGSKSQRAGGTRLVSCDREFGSASDAWDGGVPIGG